ncbi:MAG: hypothetical protein IJ890_07575 [Clostridia bacterium]|nr:hypothetical protein [Clostridia bacterium]
MILKATLLIAAISHILCGISDCLLSYSPKGKLNLKEINDANKMSNMFKDMPLSYPMISILLGTFAITAMSFGYFSLSNWMNKFMHIYSVIMFISAIWFLMPIVTHHVFCGIIEWIYIRLNRTNEVREAVLEFQKKTIITMFIGYMGLLTFAVVMFIAIITGQTNLPRWACIFNTLPLFIILAPTKLPAKGNIAGAIMFLGLFFLIS